MRLRSVAPLATVCVLGAFAATAQAQTATPAPAAPAAPATPAPPAAWTDTIKFSGHLEGGISGNFDDPANHINFGQLFTDQANSPRLNQAMLTLERDLDPKATDYDLGFKLQGMYGTDARITHFFN